MKSLNFTVNCNQFVNGPGPDEMVKFVTEADELGYDFFRIPDHVVGYVAEKHPEVQTTPYTDQSTFPEAFVLMAYLAATVKKIGFITGVLNLPQRQTALVAKQAAEVDRLTGGKLILGIGIGYNSVEFEAMESNFKERAPRVEEQVEVLRALWTQPVVTYEGRWHQMHDVNLNPRPVQRPIPIWFGAGRTANPIPPEKVLVRIAKLGDGFMPLFRINDQTGKLEDDALAALQFVRDVASDNGRDPADIRLELGLFPEGKSEAQVKDEIAYLRSLGTTHIHIRLDNRPPEEHFKLIRDFAPIRDAYVQEHGRD